MCLTKGELQAVEVILDDLLTHKGQEVNLLSTEQVETLWRHGIVARHATSKMFKFTPAGGALFESHRLRRKAEKREYELQRKLAKKGDAR